MMTPKMTVKNHQMLLPSSSSTRLGSTASSFSSSLSPPESSSSPSSPSGVQHGFYQLPHHTYHHPLHPAHLSPSLHHSLALHPSLHHPLSLFSLASYSPNAKSCSPTPTVLDMSSNSSSTNSNNNTSSHHHNHHHNNNMNAGGRSTGSGRARHKVCGVCGDRAKSYHFGGISCDSCKGI